MVLKGSLGFSVSGFMQTFSGSLGFQMTLFGLCLVRGSLSLVEGFKGPSGVYRVC